LVALAYCDENVAEGDFYISLNRLINSPTLEDLDNPTREAWGRRLELGPFHDLGTALNALADYLSEEVREVISDQAREDHKQ